MFGPPTYTEHLRGLIAEIDAVQDVALVLVVKSGMCNSQFWPLCDLGTVHQICRDIETSSLRGWLIRVGIAAGGDIE